MDSCTGYNLSKDSGILLHITALPNQFGIGDFGSCSRNFILKLKESHQRYWQILPLNYPDEKASPYSALSAFAGNIFLLSPEVLEAKGLLSVDEVNQYQSHFEQENEFNFDRVKELKSQLLNLAFERVKTSLENNQDYVQFKKDESFWLNYFCKFIVLTEEYGEKFWLWPNQYLDFEKSKQIEFEQFETQMTFHCWLQFEFKNQWMELKQFSHENNVSIIGDIPIFVSHHSADVWTWKEGFRVKEDGQLESEAGVPPDQFSDDGQKWSMPTYRWDNHQSSNFSWWRKRISKQFDRYDLIRLDHFIGFYNLFNIPPEDKTAANGKWEETPGKELISSFYEEFHHQTNSSTNPFIAEDLGEITEEVTQLRKDFSIPSMKVFQFGFWSDEANDHHPTSITNNSFYYSGTHDTTTLKGWLDNAPKDEISRLRSIEVLTQTKNDIHKEIIESILFSHGRTVIFQLQDVLFLDDSHRFNIPGTQNGNWRWRATSEMLYGATYGQYWDFLKQATIKSNRSSKNFSGDEIHA